MTLGSIGPKYWYILTSTDHASHGDTQSLSYATK